MSRKHLPVFSKLLRVFIFIAKARKLSFEKYYSSLIRKSQKNRKKLRFMEHYNYGFLGEYEFSPSNTPLIRYPRKQFAKNRGSRELESLFFLCRCWGSLRVLEGEDNGDFAVEALPASSTGTEDANALALLAPTLDWGSEEASIDLRAQRFIERFYEDMRMQRQESI
ncbi:hypothetical protein RchiOBHm_Chr4g0434841 [Rosa chinensis]|uniref:Cotton fiber protein n=1 Tax=Rosa chinensis TaxID=74649 RepID=A0A2P6R1N0_ROSCH|nr:uncharacterized protein LOC112200490 [Rosa chinensis]PRQ40328.1 hypothetical protein RchiOBHm_Chr4g0434841 [Rosa chinensis]